VSWLRLRSLAFTLYNRNDVQCIQAPPGTSQSICGEVAEWLKAAVC
jgi:hypothetical protein